MRPHISDRPVIILLPILITTKATETPSSSSDTTSNTEMQADHIIAKSEDFSNDEFLRVFTMSGDFVAPGHGPSMSSPGHRRNQSSESASSLVERSTPLNRTHPSLPYARTSPNTAPTSLPGQDMRYLSASAVPPAYTTSSSTATPRTRRRDTPSEEDDDDYVDDLPPNATDQERAEHKRRLNTLAARRSRRRRLAEFQRLNDDVTRLSRECDIWKERAMMMARMMSAHGISYPPIPGMSTMV
ncbi:hypothetical protein D9619_002404 [Psilocybe cf. subviscida]|uniref:BZIP domain-containing protein n=1 Tax=Psilocybe cf. subviscida TaxID=2480587 RepID=A0A8H5AY66_9AGAR|nr:hypothetical protein D9619_002404 [Psilocybe cf. subviscida]